MEKIIIENLSDLEKLAERILVDAKAWQKKSDEALVIALSGNLGAGKTTLVQILARLLGVKEKVTSPTFTIMKAYPLAGEFSYLIHMDAYRLEDAIELRPLHFFEILKDKTNILCIEWAEKIQLALPDNLVRINIELLADSKREVSYLIDDQSK